MTRFIFCLIVLIGRFLPAFGQEVTSEARADLRRIYETYAGAGSIQVEMTYKLYTDSTKARLVQTSRCFFNKQQQRLHARMFEDVELLQTPDYVFLLDHRHKTAMLQPAAKNRATQPSALFGLPDTMLRRAGMAARVITLPDGNRKLHLTYKAKDAQFSSVTLVYAPGDYRLLRSTIQMGVAAGLVEGQPLRKPLIEVEYVTVNLKPTFGAGEFSLDAYVADLKTHARLTGKHQSYQFINHLAQ